MIVPTSPGGVITLLFVLFFLLAIWTVAVLGLVYILGHSIATQRIRTWLWGAGAPGLAEVADGAAPRGPLWRLVVLLECPACSGFWIGILGGWYAGPFIPIAPNWLVVSIAALYTTGAMFLLGRLTGLMKVE